MAAVTAPAASRPRRYSSVASTVHPCSSAAGNGAISHAASGAGYRAGALVGCTLVPVPTSDEEHGCTVGNGTYDSTGSNTSSGSIDRTACVDVTSKRTAITSSSTDSCSWATSDLVGARVIARKFASWQWAGSVDQVRQVIDRLVLVVPERISWVAELSS